jgi:hypothetical protein
MLSLALNLSAGEQSYYRQSSHQACRSKRDHHDGRGHPGTAGFVGEDEAAVQAQLSHPNGIALMSDGGFLNADADNNVVRKVAPDGTIHTVAGTVAAGFAGDGGPAISAELDHPIAVVATPDGGSWSRNAADIASGGFIHLGG